jgi:HD superfamily phosphodiesterase
MSAKLRKRVGALTLEFGGEYAVAHAVRLVRLVELIADGPYDAEAIWLAAHLHDWGTFPRWSREGVNHSVRSRDLAETEFRKAKCSGELRERVLEAIAYHHGGADERCVEAILLRDADALDGLGAMGLLREFASIPTETAGGYTTPGGWGLRGAYERASMRLENNPGLLRLPKSRALAREKTREMRRILAAFERESYGTL